MLSGWRGRIGRSVPEPLIRQLLERTLLRSGSPDLSVIRDLQEQSEQRSVAAANELGIEYRRISSSSSLCLNSKDWPRLHQQLKAQGLSVRKLHNQYSFAAEAAWSVSTHSTTDHGIADLLGCGTIWQLFPGGIAAVADAQDFDGQVDAVYTWVDSEDPQWKAAYQQERQASRLTDSDSAVNRARFTSRDELRYSLRSLEMNLPWIDKIYLVTAGQRPDWLVDDHPKLTVVDHREIFTSPAEHLPTFNSHAIESQLANIPGLKEHFLYVNDDVFFGRYLHPNTFYGPAGQTKYCLTQGHFAQAEDLQLPVNQAASNNRDLVLSTFGRTTSRKFQHVAHPQRLVVHRRIQQDHSGRIQKIAGNRFRSGMDLSIPSSLAHQFAAQMGLGYPTKVQYQYLDIGSATYYLDLLRLARNPNVDMFCINEVLSVPDEATRGVLVKKFLNARFPLNSSFEKE